MIFGTSWRYCGRQIGNYKIIQCIGEGRYGVCFSAEANGEKLILKRLKPRIFNRNKGKNNYEVQILSKLYHSGIPRFLEIVNENGFYGFVLEQKHGDTVEAILFKQKHRFTNKEIFNIGKQLIEIIKYLHEKGIIHRDIRIPNVLINDDKVSLIDFGLARWADNNRYTPDIDFSYFGDFLLYLLYSSYQKGNHKNRPWYEELSLTGAQRMFLKRLLKLEEPYKDINEIARDFQIVFGCESI